MQNRYQITPSNGWAPYYIMADALEVGPSVLVFYNFISVPRTQEDEDEDPKNMIGLDAYDHPPKPTKTPKIVAVVSIESFAKVELQEQNTAH